MKWEWSRPRNTNLGHPEFHVPVWKQFHEFFFIATEQRKSRIKTLFKRMGGNIREAVRAEQGDLISWPQMLPGGSPSFRVGGSQWSAKLTHSYRSLSVPHGTLGLTNVGKD